MTLQRYEFICPSCGQEKVTFVDPARLEARKAGLLIQQAFPPQYFDATYREIFITGFCSKCQAMIFADPDEEEEQTEAFDVDAGKNEIKADTDNLEAKMKEIYEAAERG